MEKLKSPPLWTPVRCTVFWIIKSLKKLPELCIRESYVRPVAANGEIIPLVGQVFVTITVGHVEEIIQVCIQHISTTSLLLGTNFLCRFKCIEMNWAKSEIKFKNASLPCTGMIYNTPECRGLVSLEVATVIPAKSIIRFPVPLRHPYSTASTVEFEPKASRNQNLYFAASICEVVDAKIPIKILKLNSYPVKLYENSSIGTVRLFIDHNTDGNALECDKEQQDMYNLSLDNINIPKELSNEVRRKLVTLLTQYPNLYANEEKDCGATNLVEHRFNIGDNKPVRKFPYRISPKEKEIIAGEVQLLEEKSIIRKSTSPWATNTVLVRKKDGESTKS